MDSTNPTNQEMVRWSPTTDFEAPTNLPLELIFEILSHLKFQDIVNFALTCRHTTWVCAANRTWHDLVKRHFSQFTCIEGVNHFEKYRIYSNFLENNCHTLVLQGHKDLVTCYAVDEKNHRLISGSRDGALKVWDLQTGDCLTTLKEHDSTVMVIATHNETLISVSADGVINLWNLKNNRLKQTLNAECEITHFAFNGQRLVARGFSHTTGQNNLLVWNIDTLDTVETIETELRATAIALDGERIVVGWESGTVSIYDYTTEKVTDADEESKDPTQINSIVISDNVIFASSRRSIKRWNLQTLELLPPLVLNAQDLDIHSITLWEGALIANCTQAQKECQVVWDLKTGQSQTLSQYKPERYAPLLFHHNLEIMSLGAEIEVVEMNTLEESVTYNLLKPLGILTAKDYAKELECRPEDLLRMGIQSSKDVEIVCGKTVHLQPLEKDQKEDVEENPRALQSMAWDRKEALKGVIDKMAKAIEENKAVCQHLQSRDSLEGMWETLENTIKIYQGIIEECDNPAKLLEWFSSRSYNRLVDSVNDLIEPFKEHEKLTQIERLKNYIWLCQDNSNLIPLFIEHWDKLRASGFHAVSQLQPERQKYNMLIEIFFLPTPEEG